MRFYIAPMVIVFCWMATTVADAQTGQSATGNHLRVVNSDAAGITFEVHISDYQLEAFFAPNGERWHQLHAPELLLTGEPGKPALPLMGELIGIPPNGNVTLSILASESHIEENIRLYPTEKINTTKHQQPLAEFYQDEQIYQQDAFYPAAPVRVEVDGFWRDLRIAKILIAPFAYNPIRQQLRVITTLRFRVEFPSTPASEPIPPPSRGQNTLQKAILNYAIARQWRQPRTPDRTGSTLRQTENRYKIYLDEDGIYKLDYAFFLEHEIDLSDVDPRTFRLQNRGEDVPIYVFGEADNRFDPQDYLEFYGERNRGTYNGEFHEIDPYSDRNVYWLSWGETGGLRLGEEDGSVLDPEVIIPTSYTFRQHIERNERYDRLKTDINYPNRNNLRRVEDRRFWAQKIEESSLTTVELPLQSPDITRLDTVNVRVSLYGGGSERYLTEHRLNFYLNQRLIGENVTWYGREPYQFDTADVPDFALNTHLREHQNTLTITSDYVADVPIAISDDVWLNWIELEYARKYVAVEDYIEFTIPKDHPLGHYQFLLEGFSSDQIAVYKLGTSRIVQNRIETNANRTGYNLTFQDEVLTREVRYVALTETAKKQPLLVVPDTLSTFRTPSHAAQYLIITANHLQPQAERLADYRRRTGLTVEVVTIEDVFDEFNYGIYSPYAIRDFLEYVYHNWTVVPEFVLLLGSGSQQYYKTVADLNFETIPAYAYRSRDFGYVASDNWYASVTAVNGEYDKLPDYFIGRIPVQSGEAVQVVIDKIQQYEEFPNYGDWRRRTLFVAGQETGGYTYFQDYSNQLVEKQPGGVYSTKVYVSAPPSAPEYGTTQRLLDIFDEGVRYAIYQGHGGGGIWSDRGLLRYEDVPRMNNRQHLPIIVSLTCFTGIYDSPNFEPISVRFLTHERGGAVGTIGSSGFGYTNGNFGIASGLSYAMFQQHATRFGEWLTLGMLYYYKHFFNSDQIQDSIHEYHLFGDPALEFSLPRQTIHPQVRVLTTTADSVRLEVSGTLTESNLTGGTGFYRFTRERYTDPLTTPEAVYYESPPVTFTNATLPTQTVSLHLPEDAPETIYLTIYGWNATTGAEAVGCQPVNLTNINFNTIRIEPPQPLSQDSIWIQVELDNPGALDGNLYCYWRYNQQCRQSNAGYTRTLMTPADNIFRMTSPIPPATYCTGTKNYQYCIDYYFANADHSQRSQIYQAQASCPPDFEIIDTSLKITGHTVPKLQVTIHNLGGSPAENVPVRFRYRPMETEHWITRETVLPHIAVEAWEVASIELDSLPSQLTSFEINVEVNPNGDWGESFTGNNHLHRAGEPLNVLAVDPQQIPQNWTSADQMVQLEILSANQPAAFQFVRQPLARVSNQPDIHPILLEDGQFSKYTISPLDSTLNFTGMMALHCSIDAPDSVEVWLYRQSPHTGYWYRVTERVERTGDSLVLVTSNFGTFAVFQSTDQTPPQIHVDVEAQQFADGGYVSNEPIITAIFSDQNGIDFWLRSVNITQNNIPVETGMAYHLNPHNPSLGTARYMPKLDTGTYTISIEGFDSNGNSAKKQITFHVVADFDILTVGNYPNPVQTEDDKTIFTYTLTRPADEVIIQIYTVAGRRIKTIREGDAGVYGLTGTDYHEIPWDCTTDQGEVLANGTYFYRISAKREGQTVTKTGKLSIVR